MTLRVLVSAYACEPNRGSEPGVGWNWVRQIARRHQTWVITRCNNRPAIEAELARNPLPGAHFIYYDLPRWARFWKRRRRGLYLYYYLWQLGAYFQARRLHAEIRFDVAQHATFVMYWMPSFLALLPIPFIWGPVGGGESTPRAFLPALGRRGKLIEFLRAAAQGMGRLDPFVRLTARRSAIAFATTRETEERLKQIGCRETAVLPVMGMNTAEIDELANSSASVHPHFRVATLGNLLAWKGVEFGIRAFSEIQRRYPDSEYWIVGDGPERQRCTELAPARVRFFGALPRAEALAKLAECDVLLLPSLHDSGSCVCTEAMAIGRPVVCLDLGGPGLQVTAETGIKVAAHSPGQVVADLAAALQTLASDSALRRRMGQAGQARVRELYNWDRKELDWAGVCRA
ncbi:MAG: glycosyltransferase family 4 protein [Bryobacteraceae bacterium]